MSTNRTTPPQSTPALDAPADLDAVYANLVRIAHSPSELVFDFAYFMPGNSPASVKARVIMSPLGAKLFFRAMADNIAKYEATFGEIKIPGEVTLADHLFRPPQPPEKPKE